MLSLFSRRFFCGTECWVYGNTAVETGRSTMNGQDQGKTVPQHTRFTRVWVKQQGRWRLVANHYSCEMPEASAGN
jgi:ketosteroid isomerase-like protein